MNAKKAKKPFLFNVFLSSVAAKPLEVNYKTIAAILDLSESALSKLRHSRNQKMPVNLNPRQMAERFATGLAAEFAPIAANARRFAQYARLLCDKYMISESLTRIAFMVSDGSPSEEDGLKLLFEGAVPQLFQLCYEESYGNSEREYANWLKDHDDVKSEALYQKMVDAISQGALSAEQLKQLQNVVYAANIRQQLPGSFSDFSYFEMVNNFFYSQANRPFYNSIRRTELISVAENAAEPVVTVSAKEQIVPQTMLPVDFTLMQTIYSDGRRPAEELAKAAFENLSCTVNNQPLVDYINQHENTLYTSIYQFVTVTATENDQSGLTAATLAFRFVIYPTEPFEPVNVEYNYFYAAAASTLAAPMARAYCYTLAYPCKFMSHEFLLDETVREKWGVRVYAFTPVLGNDASAEEDGAPAGGSAAAQKVLFYNWAMPGAGYCRYLYELKENPKESDNI